ncbi:hypothetical protein BGZ58_001557 [Dissophora ornata]|nr:hypothetical protein BGZ58_001557 [Dissophora ornata]
MKYRLQGLSLATLLVTLTLLWSAPVTAFGGNDKKVLLKDVQTLTLHRGKMTAGRRTSPVPQLSCVGGNACGHYEPDVVQCTNAGFDGSDVQWKCQADLPQDLRFGELDVYCEGYNNPDDPYVLKGSCGLEYKLHYINVRHKQDHPQRQTNFQPWSAKVKRKSWIETIYLWTWISIVGFILYSFVKNCFQPLDRGGRHDPPPPYRAPGGGSGGGGGGGGSGGDGPGGGWGSGWDNNNHYRNKPTGQDSGPASVSVG